METIEVTPKELNISEFKKRTAFEKDAKQIINYDCLITQENKPIILYKKLNVDLNAILWAVSTIEYATSKRTAGLLSTSSTFGYMPRRALLRDYCHASAMAKKFPKQHYIICEFAKEMIKLYEDYFPDTLEKHYTTLTDNIRPEWALPGTPFTSGIVNKNNPLKYHHDSGNFAGMLSNMLCLKNKVSGGRLACPEYDIKFEVENGYVVIFNGQEILHGVTPIKPQGIDSYRYTVVYYTMKQMWKCDSVNEEVMRIRQVKKEREFKRLTYEGLDKIPGTR